jgi:hypothetical protein
MHTTFSNNSNARQIYTVYRQTILLVSGRVLSVNGLTNTSANVSLHQLAGNARYSSIWCKDNCTASKVLHVNGLILHHAQFKIIHF